MKIVFPLSFASHQTTSQQKKKEEKKNNKLLTILQQQFASHWHKNGAGEAKNMENCYFLSSLLSFFSANWIWIKHKQLEPMECWFDFRFSFEVEIGTKSPEIQYFRESHFKIIFDFTAGPQQSFRRRHSRDASFSISLFSNFPLFSEKGHFLGQRQLETKAKINWKNFPFRL